MRIFAASARVIPFSGLKLPSSYPLMIPCRAAAFMLPSAQLPAVSVKLLPPRSRRPSVRTASTVNSARVMGASGMK